MKAARLAQGSIEIQDLPTPTPRPDEAFVRMRSAGVCHSDLHIARGDWAGLPNSMPLGHEGIGIVEALGPGAERYVSVGDRVILGLGGTGGGFWCGACEYCLRGDPRHCAQARGIMGTFSQEFCVYAKSLVKLPDHIGDEEAALACGGLTAYGAVKKLLKHHILPGRRIAVIGAAGGLGHYAVQIASAFGYKVVGVDVGEERLAFVSSLGAHTVLAADEAAAAAQAFGGVDASLVFSAKLAGFDLGLQMLRRGGLFVAVGIPASSEGNLQINPWEFFRRDPTLIYSAVGTVQDMRELVDMAAEGRVKSHIGRTAALSEIADVFDDLEAGRYVGRAVITDFDR
ncbi:MAG: alcohol dehydrogenase catalytic domain-containing protein [Acidimicrobiales bacterium]